MSQNPSLSDVLAAIAVKTREKEEALALLDARNKELARLTALANALQQFAEGFVPQGSSIRQETPPLTPTTMPAIKTPYGNKTTKDLIRAYLASTPSLWKTSEDVQRGVSEIKGFEVPMGTIGPTLSNMKNNGEIFRDGNKVALAERVRNERPDFFKTNEASAQAEAPSNPTQDESDTSMPQSSDASTS